jgi:hypothetical protein
MTTVPVEASDKTTRTRQVNLTTSPFVTVGALLDFADRLRDEEIPNGVRIDCRHAEDTRHLVGLSIRVSEERPTVRTPRVAGDGN